jgi:hypothetical protein
MPDQVPPLIHTAALLALLSKALDDQEVRHLADDRFRSDLRGLQARVKAELEERSGGSDCARPIPLTAQ